MEERKLRYGLIGCGMIARVKHMKGVAAHSGEAEVVAFCDIIPERAKNYAREYGTKDAKVYTCLLYTSPSPRDMRRSRMPSSA